MCNNFGKSSLKFFVCMVSLLVNLIVFSKDDVFDAIGKGDVKEIKPLVKSLNKNIKIDNKHCVDKSFSVGETLLNAACRKNNLSMVAAIVESLPKNCVDRFINEIGFNGETPLSCACYKNNLEMVKYLIEKGAIKSIDFVNICSQTPLYWACFNNNIPMCKYLMSKGARIDTNCFKVAKDKSELKEYLTIMADLVGFVRR